MTDRTTVVTVKAVTTNFIANMTAAARSSAGVVDTLAKQKAASLAAAKAQGEASTKIGTAFLAAGVVIAAGVGLAISKFAEFDAKMSQVQALSHATGDEMKQLSDAALHAGQQIGFGASEVADAETELVKAGIGVSDILGGALKGSLELAAAGQIDVADATEIATIALTQFKLQGKDIPHVADLLAAGADKALGGVKDLGEALKSGGLVAAQFGLTLDDTIGVLSSFANAGLIGETAGTDLRQMLLKLANPAADSEAAMKKLGISIYDNNGDFVGAVGLAGQLKDKMTALDPATRNAALATIFGSRAIAGANVLYNEGAKGIQSWIDNVDDSGFAAKQAAAKMDNLKGDVSKLGAAFDTDLIESGSNANVALRGLVQGVTSLVGAVGNLPGPVLAVGIGVAALSAGTLILGGGFLTLVPKIAAAKAALIQFQASGISIGRTLGKGAGLLAVLSVLGSAFANTGSSSSLAADQLAKVDGVADNLSKKGLNTLFKDAGTAIIDTTAKTEKFKESLNAVATGNFWENESGVAKFVDGATFGISHLSDVYKTNEAQFNELGKKLATVTDTDFKTATQGFAKMVDAAGGGKEAIRQLLQEMPDYKAKLISLAADQGKTLTQSELFNLAIGKGSLAMQIGRDSAAKLAQGVAGVGTAAQDASGDISALEDAITNFNKVQFTADDAMSAFHQSFLDIESAINATTIDAHGNKVKTFTGTLDQNTQEGIDNAKMLRDLAQKTNDAAAKTLDLNGNVDDANAVLADGRAKLEQLGGAFGLSGQALQTFIDTYVESPKDLTYNADVAGLSSAQSQIDAFIKLNANHQIAINVRSNLPDVNGNVSGNGRFGTYASGGYTGDGSPTQVAGVVHKREWVSDANTTAKPANLAALKYMQGGGDMANWSKAPQTMYLQAPVAGATHSTYSPTFNITEVTDPIGTANAVNRRAAGQSA